MLVHVEEYSQAFETLQNEQRLVVDLETTGLNFFGKDVLCGIAVGTTSHEQSFYFPFRHGKGYNLPIECLNPLLTLIFGREFTNWNSKFDIKGLRKDLIRVYGTAALRDYPPHVEDVMLALHLLDENSPNFKLKDTGDRYAAHIGYQEGEASAEQAKLDFFLQQNKLKHGDMWLAPSEIVSPYAERDVILTERLRTFFIPALERWGLYNLWQDMNSYSMAISRMEERGIAIDVARLALNSQECTEKADECLSLIRSLSGDESLNPNSAVLYKGYINIGLVERGKPLISSTEVSQCEELLTLLNPDDKLYKIVEAGIDYRRWLKAKSTYYDAFEKNMAKGLIHPNIKQHGTVTGRPSCESPNLLAIPRAEETFQPKNKVKEVFVAKPGYWLVEADLSQAELRMIASVTNCTEMVAALRAGRDVHAETAAMMGGIPRSIAKRINFASVYGIGADSFVADVKNMTGLSITVQQASKYLKQHHTVYPQIRAFYYDIAAKAQKDKFIRMPTGRVRHYNGREFTRRGGIKASPYQKASSNMIQGCIGEAVRLIHMRMEQVSNIYPLLQVYDSFLLDVPEGRYDLLQTINELMTVSCLGDMQLAVPLTSEIKYGYRWSELKKWKGETN